MKYQALPVKRRPVPKGILKRLHAITRSRKQRVAATAEMDGDDGGSKISRALTIIFLIHIVAIGGIFVHQKFLDSRMPVLEIGKADKKSNTGKGASAAAPVVSELPRFAAGEKHPYFVRQGDNYTRIAMAAGVEENDLRAMNQNVEIVPGLMLKIPPKRIVATEPPEVVAMRSQEVPDQNRGLVEAVPASVSGAPRAQVVPVAAKVDAKPVAKTANKPDAKTTTKSVVKRPETISKGSAKTYLVKSGDNLTRIASRHSVKQDALMKANGITDPGKIRIGMSLVIP
ncbi:MAG: LysM peptidoglycan-binding domain-containing protein [Akkermansiaceae bacterium]|nr:LysM peptidoglycan-binding domain-containing protein [Akkermansiaceae bacterium]